MRSSRCTTACSPIMAGWRGFDRTRRWRPPSRPRSGARSRRTPTPPCPTRPAALAFFLVMNHPFVDGNKRTGLVALETFVELNGWTLTADDDTLVNVWTRLARGDVEPAAFFAWVNSHLDQRPATPPTDV